MAVVFFFLTIYSIQIKIPSCTYIFFYSNWVLRRAYYSSSVRTRTMLYPSELRIHKGISSIVKKYAAKFPRIALKSLVHIAHSVRINYIRKLSKTLRDFFQHFVPFQYGRVLQIFVNFVVHTWRAKKPPSILSLQACSQVISYF